MSDSNLLCYNRGCGQRFSQEDNHEEACRHHIGVPVFHDAYKGWSCCKKKCTDFTEFLNIKGCTVSKHSNIKPPEPEKPQTESNNDVIEYTPPLPKVASLVRPPFDSPLVVLNPEVSPALRDQLSQISNTAQVEDSSYNGVGNVPVGTTCKNNSCKMVYEGPETLSTSCIHHPGYPVFHEGLKFWSCCTKRTTDFNAFLEQVGCTTGDHSWFKKKTDGEVKCRLDWHQTGTHVFVSVFGKKCCPASSKVELSPVRLKLSIYFPEQGGTYSQDLELRGIVDVENSCASMFPTKVEVKLRKKEVGSWSKLNFPRELAPVKSNQEEDREVEDSLSPQVESVDLSDIGP